MKPADIDGFARLLNDDSVLHWPPPLEIVRTASGIKVRPVRTDANHEFGAHTIPPRPFVRRGFKP